MEPDPRTVARQMFGTALRHYRSAADLSLRELGKRALYDYSRLSRAERGEHLIDAELTRTIDQLLGAGGLLTVLRDTAEHTLVTSTAPGSSPSTAMAYAGGGDPVTLELRTPDGRSMQVSISRREFTQLLTLGGLSNILPAGVRNSDEADRVARTLEHPHRVDHAAIDYFRRLLAEHYTADKMLGPRQLLGPVTAQLEVLDSLRRHTRPPVTTPLLLTLAQYAEFTGWLHQDAGDLGAALYWSDRATQWAQSAGDYQMVAYLLIRKSNIACLTDDHTTVVELAAAAQHVPGSVDPKITALASQQQARGHALLGDYDDCFSRLDLAADLLTSHSDTDPAAPVYIHHYNLDVLEEQAATCYRTAGRNDEAIRILETKINNLPEEIVRDRGHLTAKLAVAIAQAPQADPAKAAALGMSALTMAHQTGSARIARELATLDATLSSHWPTHPDVAALHEALAAYGAN